MLQVCMNREAESAECSLGVAMPSLSGNIEGMGALSMGYALLLPVYLLVALFYNFFLRTKKKRDWEARFMCQKCGFVWNPDESHRLGAGSPA
jgi:hypothetical protein